MLPNCMTLSGFERTYATTYGKPNGTARGQVGFALLVLPG